MSRTKAARQSKIRKSFKAKAEKLDAKLDEESNVIKTKRIRDGHAIQEVINQGPISVAEVAKKSGFTEDRVQKHVDYWTDRGYLVTKKGKVLCVEGKKMRRRGEKAASEE